MLGEALIDLIQESPRTAGTSNWTGHCGGGPMNTAVALARLGQDVSFLGRVSGDAFGQQLRRHMSINGVQLDLAVPVDDPTTLAVVALDAEGKASYSFHTVGTTNFNWTADEFPQLGHDDWVHFGSIGAVLDPSFAVMEQFLDGLGNRMSFDLNVRPSVLNDPADYRRRISALLEPVGRNGGFAKASDEDLEWLCERRWSATDYAQRLVNEHGLEVFLLTLGPQGACAIGPDGELCRVPGRSVELVDTVGAGDTFNAGFLSTYRGNNLLEALTRGVGASALVCTRVGAQPPTSRELDEFLDWTKSIPAP